MRTPHNGTLWGELSRYFGNGMGGAGENAGTEDKLPTIRDRTWNSENTKQQNYSMSVTVCRRSSAQDFLRDADISGLITGQQVHRRFSVNPDPLFFTNGANFVAIQGNACWVLGIIAIA